MPVLNCQGLDIASDLSAGPSTPPRAIAKAAFTTCLVLGQAMFIAGCGGDSAATNSVATPPAVAPAISSQPFGQSVPMGLTATYAVTATGSAVQFQWKKNGISIAGANGNSYTTPATVFADSGASFSVTVSNSVGTTDSTAAALTVTARAPRAGDLRFQQVDAPSTVAGWGIVTGVSATLLGRAANSYSQSMGTPFFVGLTGNCSVPPTINDVGCGWRYSEAPDVVDAGSTSASVSYASDAYANFQADLQSSTWPDIQAGATALTPSFAGSVITSLDLEPASALFALSWIQSTQESGFLASQNTVAPANLQGAAVQEGAAGRVITAISYDAGQITYLAYGWQADAGTVYDSQVVTASAAGAAAAAADLAAQGYIITASGRADDDGDVLLVGTRLHGDTMARPFMAADGPGAVVSMQQGYAIVAVISDITQAHAITFIMER